MNDKLLIGFCILLVLVSFSTASLNDNLTNSFKFESNSIDTVNSYDLTYGGSGSPTYDTGVDGNAFVFDGGANEYVWGSTDFYWSGKSARTISAWIKPSSVGGDNHIFSNCDDSGDYPSNGESFEFKVWTDSKLQLDTWGSNNPYQTTGITTISTSTWYFVTAIMYGNGTFCHFLNGNIEDCDGQSSLTYTALMGIGNRKCAVTQGFDGYIDEVYFWDRALTGTEILELNDSTFCVGDPCLFAGVPVNDTTPPVVTLISTVPENLTVLNAIENDYILTYQITDNVQIDNLTVQLNYSYEHIEIYINGTRTIIPQPINYTNASGDYYTFYMDEHNYLSGTYNLDPEIFESNYPMNDTLSSLNSWLKIQFYNVTNDHELMFTEYFDENATAISCLSEYYYCNVNYTTGNPTSNEWCTNFFTGSNTRAFNHIHDGGNSKHHIMLMPINTTSGTINNLYVTPVSYILKRGTTCTDRYYYQNIEVRPDAVQTSNNNGNAWTDQSYIVDAHIHQINNDPLESLLIQASAQDNSSNFGISTLHNESIDFPIFPPVPVTIFSPFEGESYNITILVNHTPSFSVTGQNIVAYEYYYKVCEDEAFTLIDDTNYPLTTYSWDIQNFLNGNYSFKVVVLDDLNQTTNTTTQCFFINNPLSVSDQLLQDISDKLSTTNGLLNIIGDGSMILGLIVLMVAFIYIGWKTKFYLVWAGAGLTMVLIGLNQGVRMLESSNFFIKAMTMVFVFGGIVIILVSSGIQLIAWFKPEKDGFYDDD